MKSITSISQFSAPHANRLDSRTREYLRDQLEGRGVLPSQNDRPYQIDIGSRHPKPPSDRELIALSQTYLKPQAPLHFPGLSEAFQRLRDGAANLTKSCHAQVEKGLCWLQAQFRK